jgi:Na+-driven multidrug efflux pump
VFSAAVLLGGRALYAAMGGSGAALDAAVTYSNVVFAGMVLIWVFNALANVVRGTGNMAVPAWVSIAGTVILVPLSPCLIFGWGPFPALGIAGGGVALILYYADRVAVLGWYLGSGAASCGCGCRGGGSKRGCSYEILRVGAVAALITVQTNATVAVTTALVGHQFGAAAIAGYGVGSRLEYLLVPLVFGLGARWSRWSAPASAPDRQRALRTAWIGAAIAFRVDRNHRRRRGDAAARLADPVRPATRRCLPPARSICASSARATASSASAWRSISRRKAPGGCAGR